MKEIILLVAGIALGAFGYYVMFCQSPTPAHVVDATVIEQKLKEVGDIIFGEKPRASEARVRVPRDFKIFGKKIASDGAVIKTHWDGLHRFGINVKDSPVDIQDVDGKLKIVMPPYEKKVSYIRSGSIKFETVNGSMFVKKDVRYAVAMKLLQEQNDSNGTTYMNSESGRQELLKACVSAVTGIVYPLIEDKKPIEVVCQAPGIGIQN